MTEQPGPRVLLAEDYFVLARSLHHLLESRGFRVVGPAPSIAAGLELLDEQPVDAAILDVDLQGESAAPIAARLRDLGRPFLFITGFGDLSPLPLDLRDAPFVHKPVDIAVLVERIEALLASDQS